ncbi:hypothetical protein DN069_20880 [Streptacidiphilus pinicola]|uniref:Uncharacterized protein n=1 Tax=Streptacidiphilus pinicola TaxID=2219663 RepID=A0A2X0K9C7_9ACTN|nr:hypothetical protein [Streptacidiphilus pinicola]RAG83710.1 hypothetical protein DN069_20880 [Streptacidiphilus pinicola]
MSAELCQAFDEAGVPRGYYNRYDRPLTDCTWAMWPDGDGWHVFYTERGIRHPEARFDDEADACQQLWEWLAWARKPKG